MTVTATNRTTRDEEYLKAFGARFRETRETVGLTQKQVAQEMNCDHSRISQLENGIPVAAHVLAAAEQRLIWASAGHQTSFMPWLEIETTALSLSSAQPTVVPGWLQTEEYARHVLRAAAAGLIGRAELERRVAARIDRQRILDRDEPPPPVFTAIVGEAALRRRVGDREIMAAQMGHLIEMSGHPSVTLRILPFDAGGSVGLLAPFVIAKFAPCTRAAAALLDNASGGTTTDDQADVEELVHHYDRLAGESLSTGESLSLLKKAADEWAT